ncbi:MAG: ATP-binding protein [Desulfobulbaceae bacterium]|nr:ATP-binding protein [Desulfobulbaceae bacterium]
MILLISIITMILITYTMITTHINFRDTMVQQAQQQLLTIAATTADSVEQFISAPSGALNQAAFLTLQPLIDTSSKHDILYEEIPLLSFSLIYGNGLDSIFIFDLNGNVKLSYSELTGVTKSPEMGKIDSYAIKTIRQNHRLHIGAAFFNEKEELTLSITEPVLDRQKVLIGYSQRIVNLNYLANHFIDPVKIHGARRIWMFDERKVIVAHPTLEYIGLSISDIINRIHESSGDHFHPGELHMHISRDHAYFDEVMTKEDGSGIYKSCSSYDKELVAYHSLKIGDKRWGLVVTLPYNEIAGPVTEHGKRVFSLAFLTIIVLYSGSVIIYQGRKRRSELEKEADYLKKIAKSSQKLREEEQRFRDLVENSLVGILIMDGDTIIYSNPEQNRLFGEKDNAQIKMNNIYPDDLDEFSRFLDRVRSGKSMTEDTEVRFFPENPQGKQSEVRWTHCRASSILYSGRRCLLINMVDITRTKELEHLMLMKQKMVSLGHVAAGIAHEIRNPLSGINLLLSALKKSFKAQQSQDEPESNKINHIIEQLLSASTRIESVIRRVMDFAKPSRPKLVPTDINEALDQALELSAVTLKKSGIELRKNLQTRLPLCKADGHLIGQVLLNLVTNAAQTMKNTAGEKIIEISTCTMENQIIILVNDSGPGIAPHVRSKIFDPFFTTKSDSSGIGLSLSHRIITDHGGNLSAGESPWGGASFIIELPLINNSDGTN